VIGSDKLYGKLSHALGRRRVQSKRFKMNFTTMPCMGKNKMAANWQQVCLRLTP